MGKKILIVDDEKNLTTALDSFFQSKGHDIYIANSGDSALGFLKKEKADLILLDLSMPGIDGIEVARTVKKSYPGTRLLILTAYSEEYKQKLASIEPDGIMTKPFGVLTLINKVQELLGEQVLITPQPEGAIKFKPVKILFIDSSIDYAAGYIIKDYVLPYIKLSWSRNIEVEAVSPHSSSAIHEKITHFKPDIILLSSVLSMQAKNLAKEIEQGLCKPKEVILYNMPDEEAAKESPLAAYYDMQKSLMDPDYLDRLNELIKDTALKHNLIDKTAFNREKPRLPAESIKQFTVDDIANFVKNAISEELELKGVTLKDDTSFIADLGVDSLQTIQLTMALEEVFGIELPDEDVAKLQTIGDAVNYIKEKVNLEAFTKRKKSQHKILIVDDQQGMCNFLENYFLTKGYRAMSTTSAKKAVSMAAKEKPDVILLDIRMPDMDGIDTLKEIKKQAPMSKVIMVSVASEREKDAQQAGADAFIAKPFPIAYLEEAVIKKVKELTS
jgi:two-component system, response regulator, stage 0 sporulation protein F